MWSCYNDGQRKKEHYSEYLNCEQYKALNVISAHIVTTTHSTDRPYVYSLL